MELEDDRIIKNVSKFLVVLREISYLYKKLLPIIEEEHRLLQKSDISKLEALIGEKTRVGDEIIKQSLFLQRSVFIKEYHGVESGRDMSIGSYIKGIEKIRLSSKKNQEMIDHTLTEIQSIADHIRKDRLASENLVAMNIYLTKKILDHHRNTFKFWAETAGQATGIYDSSGQRSPLDVASAHQTKV